MRAAALKISLDVSKHAGPIDVGVFVLSEMFTV